MLYASEVKMARLPYTKLAPKAYEALQALGHYLHTETALEAVLLELVFLRASLLNGCGFCVGMHTAALKKMHEPETRIEAVGHWVESDAFTPRERAALRWTDVLTKLEGGHASDDDYAAVSEFFGDKDLVDLSFAIANINAWNRLGVGFGTEWNPPKKAAPVA
ncbi:MAG: carboxymuconolactone decarboxylase family protein [Acidobacteriota bacterium]